MPWPLSNLKSRGIRRRGAVGAEPDAAVFFVKADKNPVGRQKRSLRHDGVSGGRGDGDRRRSNCVFPSVHVSECEWLNIDASLTKVNMMTSLGRSPVIP